MEKKWQAESDLRTLIEAEKIKRDKARLKAAMAMQRQMKRELDSLEK
jgi:hypothetical protein